MGTLPLLRLIRARLSTIISCSEGRCPGLLTSITVFRSVSSYADGISHLGVATMVGLQFQSVAFPGGDEAVVAVGVQEGPLITGVRFHPSDDEMHQRRVGSTSLQEPWLGRAKVSAPRYPTQTQRMIPFDLLGVPNAIPSGGCVTPCWVY